MFVLSTDCRRLRETQPNGHPHRDRPVPAVGRARRSIRGSARNSFRRKFSNVNTSETCESAVNDSIRSVSISFDATRSCGATDFAGLIHVTRELG